MFYVYCQKHFEIINFADYLINLIHIKVKIMSQIVFQGWDSELVP